MDPEPFFKFDFQKHDKSKIEELARFQKHCFAIENIIEAASNLKYTKGAADYFKSQLQEPDEEFIRLIGRKIYDGMLTKSVTEQLRPAIQSALDEVIRDRIQDTLNITLHAEPKDTKPQPSPRERHDDGDGVETTQEEIEGFMIIRAIAAKHVPIDRITMRDAKSYCAVLMDDNNRRPICRLYFNSPTNRSIGIFDGDKAETKIKVDGPSDLYQHSHLIEAAVQSYK
jgi:hypothetical protein